MRASTRTKDVRNRQGGVYDDAFSVEFLKFIARKAENRETWNDERDALERPAVQMSSSTAAAAAAAGAADINSSSEWYLYRNLLGPLREQKQRYADTSVIFGPAPKTIKLMLPKSVRDRTVPKFPNASLRKYEIGRQIGAGGVGLVFMARTRREGFVVAIKVTPLQLPGEGWSVFNTTQAEIDCHCVASPHPNIIQLFEVFQDNMFVYQVMEFADCGSLYSFASRYPQSCADPNLVSGVAKGLMNAIQHLHNLNIIHRDLKPENVLVMSDGTIRVADFGWAAFGRLDASNNRGRRNTLCGTIDYLCPEMVTGSPYGGEVDMWCVGVMVFECLTGKTPFFADSETDTMKSIQTGTYNLEAISEAVRIHADSAELLKHATDFVRRILVSVPETRLTTSDAHEHPFVLGAVPVRRAAKPADPSSFSASTSSTTAASIPAGTQPVTATSGQLAACTVASSDTSESMQIE
jgi:serine/threonine protein kinase